MKKISVILSCNGLGDTLSSIPTIRYLYKIYKYNIIVFTYNPSLFKNFSYIHAYDFDEHVNYSDLDIISTFQIQKNIHPRVDIRQLHARSIGVELLPTEMHIEYYPDDYIKINNLPEKYVTIHAVQTWPSRTWDTIKWQELANKLNNENIKVVLVGKNESEKGISISYDKPTFKIDNVIDLTNKLSIDQTWHVLNKSEMVITMDSGILHLAGSTDSYILQLGSSIDFRFRAPYRKGSQKYKFSYIGGECNLCCASNLEYAIKFNKRHNNIPPIAFCLERTDSFWKKDNFDENIYRCHPTVDRVFNEIIHIYEYYNFKK